MLCMKILAVEDEFVSRKKLEWVINGLGHEVIMASDGMEGLRIWEHEKIRMVITDWIMPRMDGIDLCRRIRAAERDHYTCIIMVTIKEGVHNMLTGIEAGADDFISKPYVKDELAAKIRAGERKLQAEDRLIEMHNNLKEAVEKREQAEKTLLESEQFNANLIHNAPNPILIINPDLSIQYMNPSLEKLTGFSPEEVVGSKPPYPWWTEGLHEVFLKMIENEAPTGTGRHELPFIRKNGERFWVDATTSLVKRSDSSIYYLSNWVDITRRKEEEGRLKDSHMKLEQMVSKRTEELNRKAHSLEEMNAALKVLLKAKEEYKQELDENVASNIEQLIKPCVDLLKKTQLDTEQTTYIGILESHISDMASPFIKKLSSKFYNLTPREIKVASLIKTNKSTKEIAKLLGISTSAVVFHRHNIRKKLGLVKRNTNLRSFLQSFQ
jgi:PAS domain S-box-containing protein